jgi:hypothetical protein
MRIRHLGNLASRLGTKLEVKVRPPAVKHAVSVLQIERWLHGATTSPNERVREGEAQDPSRELVKESDRPVLLATETSVLIVSH